MMKSTDTRQQEGFTLVELMITMAITGVIVAAIYSAYLVQQRVYTAQNDVTEMQQNVRAGLMVMARDIRIAGLDPSDTANAGFVDAKSDALAFTVDLDGDGKLDGAGENIGYDLYTSPSGVLTLGRLTSTAALKLTETPAASGHYEVSETIGVQSHQPLAENIEKMEFYYLLEDGTLTTSPTATQRTQIASVQLSILARASRPDQKFTNNRTYTTASGVAWAVNDHYRRRFLITTVDCRNMGL